MFIEVKTALHGSRLINSNMIAQVYPWTQSTYIYMKGNKSPIEVQSPSYEEIKKMLCH